MISTPQEVESAALAVANWIVYNQKPFVLPAGEKQKVYLTVLSEAEFAKLTAPPAEPVEATVVEAPAE